MILHYTQVETLVRAHREQLLFEAEQQRLADTLPPRQWPALSLVSRLFRREVAASPQPQLATQAGC